MQLGKIEYISIFFTVLLIISCSNQASQNKLYSNKSYYHTNTYYKTFNDTIYYSRYLEDSLSLTRLFGSITIDSLRFTTQNILDSQVINKNQKYDSVNDLIMIGYRNKGMIGENIMRVKLLPNNYNFLEVLSLRHEMEEEIDSIFHEERTGSWFAGDSGNMLFEISNWDKSLDIVIKVATNRNINDQILIARSVYISEDNWNYDIVYPLYFEGRYQL